MLNSELLSEKNSRHSLLQVLISENPLITDHELASRLHVSISTIRLDRAFLNIPQLRERLRTMAQSAVSKLHTLSPSDVIGELLDLEPNKYALSILRTVKDMASRFSDIVSDTYVYSQASSVALTVMEAADVIIGSTRAEYKGYAHVGDILIARAKAGVNHNGKKIVSVHTSVGEKEIFAGRFIMEAFEC